MSDNLKVIEQTVETVLDENGAPGSILALDHKNFVKEMLAKLGKWTGGFFVAEKQPSTIPSGKMSFNGNSFDNTSEFTIELSKLSTDLNDFGEVLKLVTPGSIIHFKDYVGRSAYFIFNSYAASDDGSGNDTYEVKVVGLASNPTYIYGDAESEIGSFSFYVKPSTQYRTFKINDKQTTQFSVTPDRTINISYTGSNVTDVVFDEEFTDYIHGIFTEISGGEVKLKLINHTTKKMCYATINAIVWATVNDHYKVTLDAGCLQADFTIGDVVEVQMDASGSSSSSSFSYLPEISTNSNLDGATNDPHKITPINTDGGDIVLTVQHSANWDTKKIGAFERSGVGSVQFLPGTNVILRGVRTASLEFFILDSAKGSVYITHIGLIDGFHEFAIVGNLQRGYTGQVTIDNAPEVTEGATGVDLIFTGLNHHSNMMVLVKEGGTLNSFNVDSSTQTTVNVDVTGLETENFTIVFDNFDGKKEELTLSIGAASLIPTGNIFAYYKMENANDSTANGHDASTTAFTFSNDGVLLKCGTTGAGYMQIPDHDDFTINSPFTIAGYIYWAGVGGDPDLLINKRVDLATGNEWQLWYDNTDLSFKIMQPDNSANYIQASIAFTPTLAQFYYIAVTYDNSGNAAGLKITIDDVLQLTTNTEGGTFTGTGNSPSDVFIGRAGWAASNFHNGRFDEIAFLNVECTLSQLQAMKAKIDGGTALTD